MTCREFVEFMMAYLDEELPSAQRDEFEAHIERCPQCVCFMDSYQETIRLGKSVCQEPDQDVPDCVPEQLVEAILAARKKQASD